MEFIAGGLVVVIVLLYQLHKQLISICNNLPNSIKNENVSEDNGVNIEHNNKYNKKLDYIDNLARWVEENKKDSANGDFRCRAKCNRLSGFSLSGDVESSDNTKTPKEKNVIDIKKGYDLSFEGIMESYYGNLPSMENVCDFVFNIHFEEDIKKRFFKISVGQDFYDDYGDSEYYKGKHTVTLDIYEDISEFEKYNALLCAGKNLGADVFFKIDVSKIKMNENMIDNTYVPHIGKLSWFEIFILDK